MILFFLLINFKMGQAQLNCQAVNAYLLNSQVKNLDKVLVRCIDRR